MGAGALRRPRRRRRLGDTLGWTPGADPPAAPGRLKATTAERRTYRPVVREILARRYPSSTDYLIAVRATRLFSRAEAGWPKCPGTIVERLRMLLKVEPGQLEALRQDIDAGDLGPDLRGLPADERRHMEGRRHRYAGEYDLNASSDQALLDLALMAELRLFRLRRGLLEGGIQAGSKETSEAIRSARIDLVGALQALGITRAQRADADKTLEGSVAALAARYEAKKARMAEIAAKDLTDEALVLRLRAQRGSGNRVSAEDLAALRQFLEAQRGFLEGDRLAVHVPGLPAEPPVGEPEESPPGGAVEEALAVPEDDGRGGVPSP